MIGGRQAEEEAEDQATCPAGERQLCRPDNKAEARAVGECAEQRVAFVRELNPQHRQHYHTPKISPQIVPSTSLDIGRLPNERKCSTMPCGSQEKSPSGDEAFVNTTEYYA
jgi:hypothetical protein